MIYFLYLFGFLPSIIWLLFYLRKDAHPESNRMILKIFCYGMLAAVGAIFLETGFQPISGFLKQYPFLQSILVIFIGGALIEEGLKYLVVKWQVVGNPELDEPPDILLYMIISALGFAALENILFLSKELLSQQALMVSLTNFHPILVPVKALELMGWRFISATFLHALCSGILGYFLALSFFHIHLRRKIFWLGLGIVTTLHGTYNWSIMEIEGLMKFILPLIILITLAYFVSLSFKKLKRLKSICIIATKYEKHTNIRKRD